MSLAVTTVLLLLFADTLELNQQSVPSVEDIISQSSRAIHEDWRRAPEFDFCEADQNATATRTYQVMMISGSPYSRLAAVNGTALSSEMQSEEAEKLNTARQQRQEETPEARQHRVAQYEKVRRRNQQLLEEMTNAMQFTLIGSEKVGPYETYVLDAQPKPGYVPRSIATKVLSGMRGRLWIDRSSYRWVKVRAEVVRSVMIEGFLARVEPGTQFELEELPVDSPSGIWLASHFAMRTHATIIWLFPKSSSQDETYFHYKASGTLRVEDCQQP